MSLLTLDTSEGLIAVESELALEDAVCGLSQGALTSSAVSRVVPGACVAFSFTGLDFPPLRGGQITGAGVVAVVISGADQEERQLVISLAPLPDADGLRVVGRVRSGMRVVARIASMRHDAAGALFTPVVIRHARVERRSGEAPRPAMTAVEVRNAPRPPSKLLANLFA